MDKPTVIRLDITDLRRAVDDAAFRALVEKGWTVLTSVVISDEDGQYIQLVMVPPRLSEPATIALPAIHAKPYVLGIILGMVAYVVFASLV